MPVPLPLPRILRAACQIALLTLACPVLAEDVTQPLLPVPSGQPVYWLETIHGLPGLSGLAYRFRFVAPDLADLVPMAGEYPQDDLGSFDEPLTDDDMAALSDMAGAQPGAAIDGDDIFISLEELDLPPVTSEPGAEAAADQYLALEAVIADQEAWQGEILPPMPESLLRDPMHDDIVWLCENFVLPRLSKLGPRPREIIISLSDRPTVAGEMTLNAVQLFEAFTLPPDRDECVWEPY
ncbi:DUF6497 family protein [Paracoccus jeotgali]|uniref:Uncharacterized protein n=1 Tax=Paracoccus jeotgali TaxID=2065379 RepID=A0A2K9MEK8_9RHOB|nr:DUF6497 family protein [Paracoccus jeotgali]AUM74081.1 hypothetical protein CYR75_07185 [Paracoccus jeotgali]